METVNDTRAPSDPPPYKQPDHRLTRSTDDKVVSGLAGGLGRYFGIDPVVFRIAFVVLTLAGGSGALLYLVGWLMIPDDRGGTALHRFGGERRTKLLAAVLAGIGVVILLDNVTNRGGDIPVGLVLVAMGGLYLWTRRDGAAGGDDGGERPVPPTPPAPPSGDTDRSPAPAPRPVVTEPSPGVEPATGPAPAEPATGPMAPAEPATGLMAPAEPATGLMAPAEPATGLMAPAEPATGPMAPAEPATGLMAPAEPATVLLAPAGPAAPSTGPPRRRAKEPKPRSAVVPVTLSLLAVLAGGLSLAGVSAETGLGLALLLTGGALIFGAWRGRAKWLIPVGVLLALALGVASLIDVPVRGGAGDVAFRPAALEEIATPYRLAAGQLVVDLATVDFQGQTVTVVASVAAGHVEVIVPEGVAVDVDAHVGAGTLQLLGRESDGFDIGRRIADPGSEGAGRLVLRARAGMGLVEVRRAAA